MSRLCVIGAVLAVIVLAPSCRVLRRGSKPAHTRAPQAKATRPFKAPPEPKPVFLPAPPLLEAAVNPGANPEIFMPSLEPPPRRRAARPVRPREAPESEAEVKPAAPPASVPQLEQILTPEQQREYTQAIDRNLSTAQRTLNVLNNRRLNSEQTTYRDRIRTFIEQAEEARKSDLVRAKSLAERASVLAQDLLKTVQ